MPVQYVELGVPGTGRMVVRRGGNETSAPASFLRKGDDVFCTGDEVNRLTDVQQIMCQVELYEIEFTDRNVEVFTLQQLPEKTFLARSRIKKVTPFQPC